jgi:hypothetical protein
MLGDHSDGAQARQYLVRTQMRASAKRPHGQLRPAPARCYPSLKKVRRSGLMVAASVVGMPCGKPL